MLRKYTVLLALLILVGCNASTVPTSVFSPTLAPTPKAVNTIQFLTTTPLPSATRNPSPIATKMPTVTSTPIPTLTTDEEQALVQKMLQDNGGCELPCWWGIAPSMVSSEAAKDVLSSKGIRFASNSQGVGLSFDIPYPGTSIDYGISVGYYIRNDVVSSIKVDGETFNLQTSKRFIYDWRRYTWDKMLTQYGPPSWVSIGFDAPPLEPDAPVTYKLTLFYEPLGIGIGYGGLAQYDAVTKIARACPNLDKVTDIHLRLVSPKYGDSVTKFTLSLSDASNLGLSLEDTTGMSMETFYKRFKDTTSQICLEELPRTTP